MRRCEVWRAYAPSASAPWNAARVAHLHRRAGFGITLRELRRDLAEGPERSIDRFLHPSPPPPEEEARSRALFEGADGETERLQAWWLERMLYGSDPLREKLTLFWHDHFATSQRKVRHLRCLAEQNELLRRHALGRMQDLLGGITADPAMLLWLDGATSRVDHPNENYAREFFELFTLGVGHYGEQDIREAARAFAGWRPWPRGSEDRFRFDPERSDAREKTILGERGPWAAADVIRITLAQPQAARLICRKLYAFLVSEVEPAEESWIDALAEELRAQDGSIEHVVGIILRSELFASATAMRRRVKSPVEWTIGLLRLLEIPRADLRLLAVAETCRRQGQSLFEPPSVAGWEWGTAWLGSAAVLERASFAARVLWGSADRAIPAFDPVAWSERHDVAADRAAGLLQELALQDDSELRIRDQVASEPADAEGLRRVAHLLLASPPYQFA